MLVSRQSTPALLGTAVGSKSSCPSSWWPVLDNIHLYTHRKYSYTTVIWPIAERSVTCNRQPNLTWHNLKNSLLDCVPIRSIIKRNFCFILSIEIYSEVYKLLRFSSARIMYWRINITFAFYQFLHTPLLVASVVFLTYRFLGIGP